METPAKAPPCLKCKWFSVTWDPVFPRSCAVFGLKCSELPAWEVFRSTGKHCPVFEKSPRIKE
ncbi:MAG: hypothetical protein FWG35_00880 [Spirochaetaceae bacterium]|nr:hypothetical protein [Spirochaetaceae bacterium]